MWNEEDSKKEIFSKYIKILLYDVGQLLLSDIQWLILSSHISKYTKNNAKVTI